MMRLIQAVMISSFYGVSIFCEERDVGFLLFIAGFTAALISHCIRYFFFDSLSRNQHCAMVPNGKSILLEFSHLLRLKNIFKKCLYGIGSR